MYAEGMAKMIQVRDVPDEVHRTLGNRAAREGLSLTDFIKRELERIAERPSMQEWLDRTRETKSTHGKPSAAELIREMRDSR